MIPLLKEAYLIYDGEGKIVGSAGKLQRPLFQLQNILNFSVVTLTPSDGEYGYLKEDGNTWTGAVGMLARVFQS
jgi:hypothetical protein